MKLLKDGVLTGATTTTGSAGIYAFNNLVPGNYSVQFVLPVGFTQVSPANVGSDLTDSDGDATLTTAPVVLVSGDNNKTLDQGFYNLALIGLEKYLREEVAPPQTTDLCPASGKPESMTFTYAPSNTFNPQQPVPTKAAIILNNGLDDDNTAYIVVSSSLTPGSGTIFFQGSVIAGANFVASKANAGGTSFGSNTYIYFYDFQGGPLLQQVQYHTSCSAPIILGAQVLSGTLFGYDGVTGGPVTLPPSNTTLGDPADTPTGPTIAAGKTVVFTYEVTNPGAVPLSNIVVLDDNETPGNPNDDFSPAPILAANGKNVGDTANFGFLDSGEKWLYRASQMVMVTGQHVNIGKATGTPTSVTSFSKAKWRLAIRSPPVLPMPAQTSPPIPTSTSLMPRAVSYCSRWRTTRHVPPRSSWEPKCLAPRSSAMTA